MEKCNIKNCKNKLFQRGLCGTHYQMILSMKRNGETTEKDLIKAGILNERKTRTGAKKQDILEMLNGKS